MNGSPGPLPADDDVFLGALANSVGWKVWPENMTLDLFLPGVSVEHVRERLAAVGGDEIGSRKIFHPESSAALAVNAFGWFIERPMEFRLLPGTEAMEVPERIEVEYCARFPWSGWRHPWLDAAVVTLTHLIGVDQAL